jgi:hypothetical protein
VNIHRGILCRTFRERREVISKHEIHGFCGENDMSDTIMCPNCSCNIEISTTLASQLREQLRRELEAEARRKHEALTQLEQTLRQRELAVEDSRHSLEHEVSQRVAKERDFLKLEAQTHAQEAIALDLKNLQDQLAEAKGKLSRAHQAELQLRKERSELEDEKISLELTVTRQLDQERAAIRDAAKREADEQHRLHEADKDKLVADLRRQIDELKRKSEQGSQQSQGEVMELDLEDLLRGHFPLDTFEAVPVGIHGGDLLHRVYDSTGSPCGTIIWEAKRTKAWNDNWLPKLRDDQRAARAHAAVLLTAEMPKSLATFGWIDGIWVTNRSCLVGLATALRLGLVELARNKRSSEGRQNRIELLLSYIAGSDFRQRIEGIVESFVAMKDDLESEKRSVQRLWAKREKQIELAAVNTANLYGDFGGIVGPSLPQIANLELAAIAADDGEVDTEPSSASYVDTSF